MVAFIGMFLFVLYFDTNDKYNEVYYNKLNFSTIFDSIYSSYTLFTFENILKLFNFTLTQQSSFLFFLIPLFYCTLFLFIAFIISMASFFYTKVISKNVRELEKFSQVRRILKFFRGVKNIVDYVQLEDFIKEF